MREHEVGLWVTGAPWVWGWRHLQICLLREQENVRVCWSPRAAGSRPHMRVSGQQPLSSSSSASALTLRVQRVHH